MVTSATATMSYVAVVSGSLSVPEPVAKRTWSRSTIKGGALSRTVNRYALTSTVVRSFPILTSLAKARTVPSCGVVRVKDGGTYCTPHRILMCGPGFYRQTRRRGCSSRGRVAIRYRCDLGEEPSLSSKRANNSRKAPKVWPGRSGAPTDLRVRF